MPLTFRPEEQLESVKPLLQIERSLKSEDAIRADMAEVMQESGLMGLSIRLADDLAILRREVAQLRKDVTTDRPMPPVGEGSDEKQMAQFGERLDEIARTLDQASE